MSRLPLSPTQAGMLFHQQHSPGSDVDLEQIHGRLAERIDASRLRSAFLTTAQQHPALRTSFRWRDVAEPLQQIEPQVDIQVTEREHDDLEDEHADRLIAAELAADRMLPFDLEQAPLMRVALHHFGDRRTDLIWTFPHLILDGRSFALVLGEVFAHYDAAPGQPSPRRDVPSFAQHLAAIAALDLTAAHRFWAERLAGFDSHTPVPFARGDEPHDPHAGGQRDQCGTVVPAATTRRLEAAARAAGGNLGTIVQGALALLLARCHANDDVVFGAARACRHSFPGANDVAGVFLNLLPVRVHCEDDVPVGAWLTRLRSDDVAVRPFELTPLLGIQRIAHVPPGASLFDCILIYDHRSLDGHLRAMDPRFGRSRFTLHERTGYPFTLYAYGGDELQLELHFDSDQLARRRAEQCLRHLVHLLDELAGDPARSLGTIGLCDAATLADLARWNETTTPQPLQLVPQEILAAAARTPMAPAVTWRQQTLTYAELVQRAQAVAARLRQLGAGPDRVVGLHLERSLDIVVGALGAMFAGAAWLPLDPDYPRDRIEFMVRDSGLCVLLTQQQLLAQAPACAVPVVAIDDAAATSAAPAAPAAPAPAATSLAREHLAYLIYTSGSTGRPKGVMVGHGNLANFCAAMDRRLPAAPGQVWLAVTSISFDISVLELIWTLRRGMHIVLHEDQAKAAARRARAAAPAGTVQFSLMYFADAAAFAEGDKYRLLLDGARFADEHGFTAVWTPERHFHEFGGLYPNPSLTSAVLSQITRRVALRAGSVVLPLHHPARVAEEWAFVDNLSHGRAGIAFASGWHERDFVLNPEAHANARQQMLSAIDQVRALWRGDAVTFRGPKGKDHAVKTLPRPVQRELPIWLTAAGNPETFAAAGRIGANILTHLLGQNLTEVRDKLRAYRDAWQQAGHPGRGHVTMMLHTFLADDDEQARAAVHEPMKAYLRSAMGLVRNFAGNWTAFKRGKDGKIIDAGIDLDQLTAAEQEDLLEFAFARYYETSTLFGTVDHGEQIVRDLAEAGVDEIACLIDFGVPVDQALVHLRHVDALRQRFVAAADATSAATGPDESIAAQIVAFGATHLQCTPSLAAVLAQDPAARAALGRLQVMMVGGENLTPSLAASLRQTGVPRLCNMYGPTETTVWSTVHDVDDERDCVPIGRPIANTQVYVIDAAGRLQPPGLPGELWIGGDGVVRGYHGRPELTAERFVAAAATGGARCYRTGDLARWRDDGTLEFIGRIDQQIKLRGHRIELGEIENVIGEHPGVQQAAVVLQGSGVEARLCAYVVGRQGDVPAAELREFLRARLPEVMLPAQFIALPALPQTPNRKIDRKALPLPEPVVVLSRPEAAPGTPPSDLEGTLMQIWQEVLRVGSFSLDDNFFDLGGHSLLAVQVHRRIEAVLPGRVTILDLFRYPSVRQLAAHLGKPAHAAGAEAEAGRSRGQSRAELRRQALAGARRGGGPG